MHRQDLPVRTGRICRSLSPARGRKTELFPLREVPQAIAHPHGHEQASGGHVLGDVPLNSMLILSSLLADHEAGVLVESEPRRGSRFYFTLGRPRELAKGEAAPS
jgi:hypothetical protein